MGNLLDCSGSYLDRDVSSGSVALAGLLANAYGCKLDEGSAHPCLIARQDRGQLLYTLGVLGWLMLVTLPAGALALAIWFVVLLLHRASWRKRSVAG